MFLTLVFQSRTAQIRTERQSEKKFISETLSSAMFTFVIKEMFKTVDVSIGININGEKVIIQEGKENEMNLNKNKTRIMYNEIIRKTI